MNTTFDWQRLWFRADARASLVEGFLPGSHRAFAPPEPSGIALSELRDTPCVILLGTPGMGKTTEMYKEAQEASARAEPITFISLASLSTPDDLGTELNRTLEAERSAIETSYWNIFLDGLDEVLTDQSQFQKAILQQFRLVAQQELLAKVRFRISCRTAEWPTALEAELRTLWAENEVAVIQLERLRQEDVERAAQQFLGVDIAAKFMEQIDTYEADPLASRPVTLRMLLNIFQQQTEFPKRQQELYRKGLLAFIQEGNVARRQNRQTWRLDVASKLIVAGRIAAAMVLSDSNEVWTGLYADVPPSRTVPISDIAGGHEPSLGSSFPVGEADLREVLLTPLFLPVGEDRFVFAHRTFAEFLAAYYLNEHELDSSQLFELLQTSEETRTIPPQLREVSAWLAGMHPDFFRELARSQPDILLRSDVSSVSPEDRELFVQQLMLAFEHQEIHDFDYQIRRRYGRLWHPNLAKQIRPYIASKNTGLVARRVAIDIAEANCLTELAQLLLDIALDRTENHHIRGQAVAAIAGLKIPEVARQLLPLAIENNPEDFNDDLKGWSLRALFPQYISVEQLLQILTPEKEGNYIGSYHMFLSELRLQDTQQSDAIAVLRWAAGRIDESENFSPFERIIPRFLEQMWELANDEKVLDAFAEFFQTVGATHKYFSLGHYFEKFIHEVVRKSTTRRHRLIANLLEKTDSRTLPLPLMAHGGLSLFVERDLVWLVDELISRSSTIPETTLIDLIVSNAYAKEIETLNFVWECASHFAELERKLSAAYSIDLTSTNAEWLREDQKRREEHLAKRRPAVEFDAVKALREGLDKIEQGSVAFWWELNLVFCVQSDGQIDGDLELRSNLTKLPLWTVISPSDRERVIAAAQRYIGEYRPRSDWLGKNVFHRPAAAGYRAFRLLQSEAPEQLHNISAKQWSKWAPAIIAPIFNYSEDEQPARIALACECYWVAPKQIYRVLRRILTTDSTQYAAQQITTLLSECYDENLGSFLFSLLTGGPGSDDLHADRNRVLLRFLVRKLHPVAIAITTKALTEGSPLEGTPVATAKGFSAAVSTLLDEQPSLILQFFELTKSNEQLAKEVISELAQSWHLERQEFRGNHSESDLADLVIWLFRTFPDREETKSGRARWVSSIDHVEDFRSDLLRSLVNKGTKGSVTAVGKIAAAISDRPWLRYQLLDARRAMLAKTWRQRTPTEIVGFIGKSNPPTKFRSTKAIIVEAAQAFQSANTDAASFTGTTFERPAETVDLSTKPKGGESEVKPRRILAVATEWKSKHGGITTVNREMCVSMSELGHEVVCVVVDSTSAEKADAASKGVRLVDTPAYPTVEDDTRLFTLSKRRFDGFEPDVVIGHDHITGAAGYHLAKDIFEVPYVHFVHTLPEGAERHKTRNPGNILDGSKKAETQKRLCTPSDLVVCVGPLIHRTMQTTLQSYPVPVIEFRPGLDKQLLTRKIDPAKILAIYCLFLARLEDGILKGADIACHVIAALNTKWNWDRYKSQRLIMRGFHEETIDRDLLSLGDISHAKLYVMPRRYSADANDIADDICMSCVMMMPSRMEAFGLSSLEAIAAGVPVLVTSSSGIGELLEILAAESKISRTQADACVTDVIDDIEATIEQWSNKVQAIISNPAAAFAAADKLRSMLVPILSWENAGKKLTSDIEAIL